MKKYLVKCKNYNGLKDVLFMMDKNDLRLTFEGSYEMYAHKGDDFATKAAKETMANYVIIAEGDYSKNVLITAEDIYTVFSDRSVRKK